MATISSLITELRTDISDDGSTRWTDAQLLRFFQKAIRRSNRIAQRNGLWFARKKATLTTDGNAYLTLSTVVSDLDVPIALYHSTKYEEIKLCNDFEWERLISPAAGYYAYLDYQNDYIRFKGTPESGVVYYLYYYPTVDPSAYTTSSSTPWSGRLDDIILEYVKARALNVDEMDLTVDMKLLSDMELQILEAYSANAPAVVDAIGWL